LRSTASFRSGEYRMKIPPLPPLIAGFYSCDNYPDTGGLCGYGYENLSGFEPGHQIIEIHIHVMEIVEGDVVKW